MLMSGVETPTQFSMSLDLSPFMRLISDFTAHYYASILHFLFSGSADNLQ